MNGLYEVSNLGNIKSLKRLHNIRGNSSYLTREHILKPSIRNGYYFVDLCKNRKQNKVSIHRVVALTFIPNIENKSQINHINGNKLDNRVDNLEWCTCAENIKHSFEIGLRNVEKIKDNMRKLGKSKAKRVIQYDKNMNFIKEWESATKAGKDLHIFQQSIVACLKGRTKTAGKYIWKYKQMEDK